MGYSSRGVAVSEILAGISDDGNKLNPLSAAEALAAITDDDTRYSGADIAAILAASPKIALSFFPTVTDVGYGTISGTFTVGADGANWLGLVLNNAAGLATDEVGIGTFFVPVSGDYTIYFLAKKDTDCGIMHVYVNNVDVGDVDLYNGSNITNQLVEVSLGTLTAGLKVVSLRGGTKHGSASAYKIPIQCCIIVRD